MLHTHCQYYNAVAAVCCGIVQHACDDGDYDDDDIPHRPAYYKHYHDGDGHADYDGDDTAHNDAAH